MPTDSPFVEKLEIPEHSVTYSDQIHEIPPDTKLFFF